MYGFVFDYINDMVKIYQCNILDFCFNVGKFVVFLDIGLGKLFIELEFVYQCVEEIGRFSLILILFVVVGQMVCEGNKFNIDACQI